MFDNGLKLYINLIVYLIYNCTNSASKTIRGLGFKTNDLFKINNVLFSQ